MQIRHLLVELQYIRTIKRIIWKSLIIPALALLKRKLFFSHIIEGIHSKSVNIYFPVEYLRVHSDKYKYLKNINRKSEDEYYGMCSNCNHRMLLFIFNKSLTSFHCTCTRRKMQWQSGSGHTTETLKLYICHK